jgi:hypothetical protein
VFEFVLTLKQGSLLSSVYAIAYGVILGCMAEWRPAPAIATAEIGAKSIAVPFPNLMR